MYNDYSLAEREFLASPLGGQLIAHWRRWYQDQPTMKEPSDGTPLLWGTGTRIVRTMPNTLSSAIVTPAMRKSPA